MKSLVKLTNPPSSNLILCVSSHELYSASSLAFFAFSDSGVCHWSLGMVMVRDVKGLVDRDGVGCILVDV